MRYLTLFILFIHTFLKKSNSMAVQITQHNYNKTLASNELVLLMFHADWDIFGKQYLPIFHEAADKIAQEFPDPGTVLLGEIDSDKESQISLQFNIWALPRVVVIRNGKYNNLDYKGNRTTEALTNFVREQLKDPIKEFKQLKEVEESQSNKKVVIGYFDHQDQPEYDMYRRVATHFVEGCQFYVGFRKVSKKMHIPSLPTIIVKPNKYHPNGTDEVYPKSLDNFDDLYNWMFDKCRVLVTELTDDKRARLYDRVPFLILIHTENDTDSIEQFTQTVETGLSSFKDKVNFATGIGNDFDYNLRKLNKTQEDLPLIIWYYYRQMFLFSNFEDINVPGKLKCFLENNLLRLKQEQEMSKTRCKLIE